MTKPLGSAKKDLVAGLFPERPSPLFCGKATMPQGKTHFPGHYQKLWLAGDETDFPKGVIDEYYRMGLRP